MPAPSLCTITGTAYQTDGAPQTNAFIDVKACYLDGAALSSEVRVIRSTAGAFSFTLPRGSVCYLYANIQGLDDSKTRGTAITIPDTGTATLESLLPAVTITVAGVTSGQLADEATARSAADAVLDERLGAIEDDYLTSDDVNVANGVAGLDDSGLIPDNRIPASIARDSEVTAAIAAAQTGERLVATVTIDLNTESGTVYTLPSGKFFMTRSFLHSFSVVPNAGGVEDLEITSSSVVHTHGLTGIGTMTSVSYRTTSDIGGAIPLSAGQSITYGTGGATYGSPATAVIQIYGILY